MDIRRRLDSISAGLADSFQKADARQRQHATLAACRVAIARTGLRGSEIDAAVDFLLHGRGDQFAARRELVSLTEQFDQQYFKLSEDADGTTPEALLMFRKARAAAALVFALSPDFGQLDEAIYEAIVASGDQAEAVRAAEVVLKSRRD